MSSVPKSKRSPTKFEAEHHFYILRDSITELMLMDFGFSEENIMQKLKSSKSSINLPQIWTRLLQGIKRSVIRLIGGISMKNAKRFQTCSEKSV
jgi:hypothetical protein